MGCITIYSFRIPYTRQGIYSINANIILCKVQGTKHQKSTMKYEINAICDEGKKEFTLYITLNDELVSDVYEFMNRKTLESGIVDCIAYMNKYDYDYEKHFLVVKEE